MPPKTPQFWYRKERERAPILEYVAGAFAPLYQLGHRWNISRQEPYRAAMPVICVGGAVAGGSGKTPVAQALMALVLENKIAKKPAFLTRGYGGIADLMYLADPEDASVEQCGDEALLLAQVAPVIVAKDRVAGAKLAAEDGVDLLVMDDGMQSNTLSKDLNLLVIDAQTGFGNGKTLPAGPLREPAADVLLRAEACVVVGDMNKNAALREALGKAYVLHADAKSVYEGENRRVLAFAGLGRPEKFFTALRDAGLDVVDEVGFSDHHPYLPREINALRSYAVREDAVLVTTEKDMARLRGAGLDAGVETVRLALSFNDEKALLTLLKGALV